ncbi:MAG: aldehyde dehydrogenase family protein [Proteobacteria bacterium]|nr:MAG: aldehyde dehydrogenase family protein [Pseudomonadota bacterium]
MSTVDRAIPLRANFIAGSNSPSRGTATLIKFAPATGEALYRICESNAADIGDAALAAREKFAWWSARTAAERSAVLLSLASALEQSASDLIYILSSEQGIPAALAREHEVPAALQAIRYWATRILHEEGGARPIASGGLAYTRRRALGPVGILGSATRPLSSLLHQIAGALASGNTVVAKPSSLAPGLGLRIAALANEAGLPPGALNFVFGSRAGAGRALVECKDIALLAFTGRPESAALVRQQAAAVGLRFYAQSGGRHATIVNHDADIAEAALATVRGAFSPLNEPGLDVSQVFVHASVAEAFAEKLSRTAELLRVGDPEARDTQVGPLLTQGARENFERYLAAGRSLTIISPAAGERPTLAPEFSAGFFVAPTLVNGARLEGISPSGPLLHQETFASEKELLDRLLLHPYQAGSFWTKSLGAGLAFAQRLPFAAVCLNAWSLPDPYHLGGGAKHLGSAPSDPWDAFTALQTIRVKI